MSESIPTDEEIDNIIKQATEQGDYWSPETVLRLAKEIQRVRATLKHIEHELTFGGG